MTMIDEVSELLNVSCEKSREHAQEVAYRSSRSAWHDVYSGCAILACPLAASTIWNDNIVLQRP